LFGPWSQHQALGAAYQKLIAEQRPRACKRRTHGGLTNAKLLGRPRDVPLDEQNSQRRQEIEVDGSEVHGAPDWGPSSVDPDVSADEVAAPGSLNLPMPPPRRRKWTAQEKAALLADVIRSFDMPKQVVNLRTLIPD
jgi:hypothetical protein